jgi:8-oxo-dGTP diphosphatase
LGDAVAIKSQCGWLTVVAAALVDADGRVLVQQRPDGAAMAGLWEFPGGKIEPGETPEAALIRELAEELGIDVEAACLAPACFASEPLGDRHLLLLLYVCRKWRGTPEARHASALQWLRPAQLYGLAMPPADRPLLGLLDALL